jgi:hypothetical protein
MYPCFDVEGISVERLLQEWKWLVAGDFSLLAVNVFGDLFLKNTQGTVCRLDVSGGEISEIADSETEFRTLGGESGNQKQWFLVDEEKQAAQRGYVPKKGKCIGCKVPWVFKESAMVPDNLCVIDLYQYVSFMGDVLGQMQDVADGGKIRLRVIPLPEQ